MAMLCSASNGTLQAQMFFVFRGMGVIGFSQSSALPHGRCRRPGHGSEKWIRHSKSLKSPCVSSRSTLLAGFVVRPNRPLGATTMASIDPFGRTDKLDDSMLAALVTRFEARGKNPRVAKMLAPIRK
jgi:hypothetical protein